MTGAMASFDPQMTRSERWKWYICVLLLFATVVNYMDRLTTNNLAVEIQQYFGLTDTQYGKLEFRFGVAFAIGSLLFGALVDRIGVFWLYPIVLVGWSAMGYMTGQSKDYEDLLLYRTLLGAFEAGHFPCGLKTVQLLMEPRDRAMGNSLLQSGTALGAILAPLAIAALVTSTPAVWRLPFEAIGGTALGAILDPSAVFALATGSPEGWRLPFKAIGAGGCIWVFFWLVSIRPSDLRGAAVARLAAAEAATARQTGKATAGFLDVIRTPRFLSLVIVVICINLTWHLFRVWLTKYLRFAHGYSLNDVLHFNMWYYLAADIGVMAAGWIALRMTRRGLSVFASRILVFAGCALATTMTTVVPFLPSGPLLVGALLVVAFGALGCFASYYSLTQDLSTAHQGKVSGSLATCTWLVTASFHWLFGIFLDQAQSDVSARITKYEIAIAVMGWLPMISLVAVLLLWNRGQKPAAQAVACIAPAATES